MKTKTQRKDAEAQRTHGTASVLTVGFEQFFFESHARAASAFSLLSEAVHVERKLKVGKDGGPEAEYEPRVSQRELKLETVYSGSLRLRASALKPRHD